MADQPPHSINCTTNQDAEDSDSHNVAEENHGPLYAFEGDVVDTMTVREETATEATEYPSETLVANPDDLLPPVARLVKYADSDIVFHRQVVTRGILETLRTAYDCEDDVTEIGNVFSRLVSDPEPTVRAGLYEQLPGIAAFCSEHECLASFVLQHLVPAILSFIHEANAQIKKLLVATIVSVMQSGAIPKSAIEEIICPTILKLTISNASDDMRGDSIGLMAKLSRHMGKDIAERLFLPRFLEACKDHSFHMRKHCASHLGEFSAVLGEEITETLLLPRFLDLCEDELWGVRKACIESFVALSSICSTRSRKQDLSSMYLSLVLDESKWVQSGAYAALGTYLSTFAEPYRQRIREQIEETNQARSLYGPEKLPPDKAELVTTNKAEECTEQGHDASISQSVMINSETKKEDNHDELNASKEQAQSNVDDDAVVSDSCNSKKQANAESKTCSSESASDCKPSLDCVNSKNSRTSDKVCASSKREGPTESPLTVTAKNGHLRVHIDSESAFNAFQYWRIPIPELQFDIDIEEGGATSVHVKAKIHDELCHQIYASNLSVKVTQPQKESDQNLKKEIDSTVSQRLDDLHIAVPKDDERSGQGLEASQKTDVNKVHVQAVSMSTVSDLDALGKSGMYTRVLSSSCNEADVTLHGGVLGDVSKARLNVFSPDMEMPLHSLNSHSYHNREPAQRLYMAPEEQDVIPPALLAQYLKMTDRIYSQTIDLELLQNCAFSFPGVTLALGSKNWLCVKESLESLASHMQWKVRWCMATSLHDVAGIIGPENAGRDLVPVFANFVRDLDEVRLGLLPSIHKFVKVLLPPDRRAVASNLGELLKMDNERNWRFRYGLAEQLVLIIELYEALDVKDYLLPLAFALVRDKVSVVRRFAIRIVALMMRHLSQSRDSHLVKYILVELAERLTRAHKWLDRQIYALLCQHFLMEDAIPVDQFAAEILPHLLYLCWDAVPNVRLAVARCLTETLLQIEYFVSSQNPHQELVMQALQTLQIDPDKDVRFYACRYPSDNSSQQEEQQQQQQEIPQEQSENEPPTY